MSKVCLIVVFNHKYNKNIPILESIYRNRFSDIFYIVPFNTDEIPGIDREKIITVYETSYCFQGYLAQSFERIWDSKYSHYVVIGDDLLLNPLLNEKNIIEQMGLEEGESYIKNIIPYGNSSGDQSNKLYNIFSAFRINTGVSYKNEIPSYEQACKLCESHGYTISKKLPISFFLKKGYLFPKHILLTFFTLCMNKGMKLPYPLYKSYADMIVIDQKSMQEFCRLSGVFAAMNIFVETAIPLAMLLSCKKIKTESEIGYIGVENWGKDIPRFEELHGRNLSSLFQNFGSNVLYYHPVKLSRWKGKIE